MKKIISMATFSALLISASIAQAAPVTFFGQDLGLGEGTRLNSYTNATAAEAAFLANLTGVVVNDLESFAAGPGPITANFGVTLEATLSNGSVVAVDPGLTNGFGRYPISGSKFWETSSSNAPNASVFTMAFSAPIAAFGFYGIDIGDFNGQIILGLTGGGSETINIGNSTNIAGGSVLYFGFYDLVQQYTTITFSNTAAGSDFFGFDNFTIGTKENVNPVPEPTTMLLFGSGLLSLAAFGRRRKA